MSTYTDFLTSKKEARAAKVKRDASILALENTCARFNSITSENANVRIFTQIDNEFESKMQDLKDDNISLPLGYFMLVLISKKIQFLKLIKPLITKYI